MLCACLVSIGNAKNCAVSKEFRVPAKQQLAGRLLDPNGAVLSGITVELSMHRKFFRSLSTKNDGTYDFGEVPPGNYRIRLRYRDNGLCAPKIQCSQRGCIIDSLVRINDKYAVTLD